MLKEEKKEEKEGKGARRENVQARARREVSEGWSGGGVCVCGG